jgi:hypothetical protein
VHLDRVPRLLHVVFQIFLARGCDEAENDNIHAIPAFFRIRERMGKDCCPPGCKSLHFSGYLVLPWMLRLLKAALKQSSALHSSGGMPSILVVVSRNGTTTNVFDCIDYPVAVMLLKNTTLTPRLALPFVRGSAVATSVNSPLDDGSPGPLFY